jgi:hypothetical protein
MSIPGLVGIILVVLLGLTEATCRIEGAVCSVTGTGITGICVPLDDKGYSADCYNVYGFLMESPNYCEDQYGEAFANVLSILIQRVEFTLQSRCCVGMTCNLGNNEGTYGPGGNTGHCQTPDASHVDTGVCSNSPYTFNDCTAIPGNIY